MADFSGIARALWVFGAVLDIGRETEPPVGMVLAQVSLVLYRLDGIVDRVLMAMRRNSREAILNAAEAVVLDRGALSLTLDAVAERAGISKGGLLYNFHTKQALLQAMVDRLCRSFEAHMVERMGQDAEAAAALSTYVAAALDRNAEGGVAASLLAAIANDPNLLAPMRARLRRWLPRLDPAAPSFADRAIVWLATEGLWLLELLNLSPLKRTQRQQIAARLFQRARAAGSSVNTTRHRSGGPHAANTERIALQIGARK